MQLLWQKFKKTNFEANVDECGIEMGIPNVGYHYTVSKDAVLHIITAGKGRFTYNNETYTLEAGDMFLVQQGMSVAYEPDYNDPWTYYWIGFSGHQILQFLQRTHLVDTHVMQQQDTTAIINTVREMCQYAQDIYQYPENDIRLLYALYKLIDQLQTQYPKPYQAEQKVSNPTLQHAIQYINTHYTDAITVEDIAAHTNISRSYLYKLFKRNLNVSPKDYLNHLRMYRASEILKHTDKPIYEIASLCGYTDPLRFSKNFKKHFELSASDYRQYHQQ